MNKFKLVYVEWVDSASVQTWQHTDGFYGDVCHCKTIGYLVEDDKKHVTISSTWADSGGHNEQISCTITIPKCAITKRKWVKL